jgi:hypothetical protein
LNIAPNAAYTSLGSWNRQASAVRLQTFTAGNCNQYQATNLFADLNYSGDCTALSYTSSIGTDNYLGSYYNPVYMGFRNDTVTSVINQGGNTTYLYSNAFYQSWSGPRMALASSTGYPDLRTNGFNDVTSGLCNPRYNGYGSTLCPN